MPVGELRQRMSAHELTVMWPLYFAYRRREAECQAEKEKERQRRL